MLIVSIFYVILEIFFISRHGTVEVGCQIIENVQSKPLPQEVRCEIVSVHN